MKNSDQQADHKISISKDYEFLDFKRILPWLVLSFFLIFFVLVMMVYSSYMMSFFAAFLIYIGFRTPHEYLSKLIPNKPSLTAMLSTLIVVVLILLPLIFVSISLISEVSVAIERITAWLNDENMKNFFEHSRWIDWLPLSEQEINALITDAKEQALSWSKDIGMLTIQQGGNLIVYLLDVSTKFIFAIFILFFLFRGADKLGPLIYAALPFPDEIEKEIGSRMVAVLDAVIKGNFFVSILQGTMVGIYFWIFGIPTFVLYGSIAAMTALIPIIGTAIIWVPAALYLYLSGQTTSAIVMGSLCIATYFALENLMKPWLLDRKLNLHPLFLFLAILGGISEFGIKGVILGPFIVTSFLSIWEVIAVWNENYGTDYSKHK